MNNSGCERVKLRQEELGSEDVIGPARGRYAVRTPPHATKLVRLTRAE